MKTSEFINDLATSLAIAQGEIEDAVAGAQNPHFNSRYADLASVRESIRGPLSKNGLSVVQLPVTIDGKSALTTRLMHKSGQWIEDTCVLIIEKPTMQGIGSALTYMKRYALTALVGLAEQDDDGNEAEKYPLKTMKPGEKRTEQPPVAAKPPTPRVTIKSPTGAGVANASDPSAYRINVGTKHKGKTLAEVGHEELRRSVDYIKAEAEKSGLAIDTDFAQFISRAEIFIADQKKRSGDYDADKLPF